jgi:hypothetical protein
MDVNNNFKSILKTQIILASAGDAGGKVGDGEEHIDYQAADDKNFPKGAPG